MPWRAFPNRHVQRPVSDHSRVVVVMEPTEDSSRDNVLGWDTAHGRESAGSERRLHSKTAMWSAMATANVLVQITRRARSAVTKQYRIWNRESRGNCALV